MKTLTEVINGTVNEDKYDALYRTMPTRELDKLGVTGQRAMYILYQAIDEMKSDPKKYNIEDGSSVISLISALNAALEKESYEERLYWKFK
jgi:hypothetical protein